MKSYKICTRIE